MPISNFPRLRFTDITEVEVLDRTAGFYVSAPPTNPLAAEAQTTAQTAKTSVLGCRQLDIIADITNVPNPSKLYIKLRFSGKESPSVATVADWGYIQVDKIDTATGISSVQEYVIEIDLNNVNNQTGHTAARRYLVRIDQISGIWASAIVWSSHANVTGKVYFQRQGGSM